MTREELRAFLVRWFCGCGRPIDAVAAFTRLLELHDTDATVEFYRKRDKDLDALIPDTGIQMLVLYALDSVGLTEHGGSVPGWLTGKGRGVLAALKRERDLDGFETLIHKDHCAHGYDDDHPDHDCARFEESLTPTPRA